MHSDIKDGHMFQAQLSIGEESQLNLLFFFINIFSFSYIAQIIALYVLFFTSIIMLPVLFYTFLIIK